MSEELAKELADDLGIDLPDPMPRAIRGTPKAEILKSDPLSLSALPGDGSVRTRKIAILVAEGVESGSIVDIVEGLNAVGAVTRLVGTRLGRVGVKDGEALEVDATLENSPSVLFDAVVLPADGEAVDALCLNGRALEFVKDQYRHCKTVMALGESSKILRKAGIPLTLRFR